MEVVQTVSAILVNPEGKILLQQRDDRVRRFPDAWTTFGGAVEAGETPQQAMRRELVEEIEFAPDMRLWKMVPQLRLNGDKIAMLEIYVFVGRIDRLVSDIRVHEGRGAAYIGVADLDRLPIAFGFEMLFREFFAVRELFGF
ncbi:MAG: NUDIX domain-containing protein [bacterium]|nr:NUDIX domain-containing protein [bacterium]